MACRAAIQARVLVVTGEDSDFYNDAKSWLDGEQGADLYPSATTVVIPGAGHMVHFEQPARLAAAIERFLREHL
jgi:pimeloyl-ACP methyl ester carboxylesterase